ncbi:hypothetical protein N9Y92_02765 [Chlamydiales bacterium]|nr:hypothetical protein [Chlamydiales bacterium]
MYSLKISFSIIIASILMISLPMGLLLFWKTKEEERLDRPLTQLALTTAGKDSLSFSFIAEALNLSKNQKYSLSHFPLNLAEETLKAYPFIQKIKLSRLPPNTLLIDYLLRRPIAFIYDWEKMAVDSKGVLFPIDNFYTPKKLPSIFLGYNINPLNPYSHHLEIDPEELNLIKKIVKSIPHVTLIDLSKKNSTHFGQREIILTISEPQTHLVRLSVDETDLALKHYLKLMIAKPKLAVVDLRLTHIAYIKEY